MSHSTISIKRCPKCGETKPTTEFNRNRINADGLQTYCRVCQHAYYAINAKKAREYSRTYRMIHAQRVREHDRIRHAANCEKRKELACAHYVANAEMIKEKVRAYYYANRNKAKERVRAYRAANPEKVSASRRIGRLRRRALEVQAEGFHTANDIRAQYKRQHGRCYYCNVKVGKDYHVDHVVPLSRGGSDWPDNIVIACPTCNISKRNKLPHEWPDGGRLL